MNIVCFHNPDEVNGYLSNWYLSQFECDGITYSSMEQYMMYQKAICFNDKEVAKKILETTDVAKIKALGREVKNFNNVVWNGLRQIIVYEGLLCKFSQNDDFKQQLLQTGNDILAECAVNDKIWAIGKSMRATDRLDIRKWDGQNLLGFALMKTRNKLRKAI